MCSNHGWNFWLVVLEVSHGFPNQPLWQELSPVLSNLDMGMSVSELGCCAPSWGPSQGNRCLCRQKMNPQTKPDITSHEEVVLTYPWFNHSSRMRADLIRDSLLTLIAVFIHTSGNHLSWLFLYLPTCTHSRDSSHSRIPASGTVGTTLKTGTCVGCAMWVCRMLPWNPNPPAPHTSVPRRSPHVASTAAEHLVMFF